MKLTNYVRDAFIRAAMADVPKVDYEEQARTKANQTLRAMFSKTFKGVDFEVAKASGWLERCGVNMPRGLGSLYGHAPDYNCLRNDAKLWAELEALAEKHSAQQVTRDELERKLRAVAYGVTTRKALVTALPEFEKYLPADEPSAVKTLPAVANVLTDFMKAGWPKGGKK